MKQKMIKEFEKAINCDYKDIAGIIVQKNGNKLYESYFNGFTDKDAVHIFSVTKSVISILIGIAIDEGYIKSVNQRVLDFFPEYEIKAEEDTIRDITIKNLLSMTASYKFESEPYEDFFASENWVDTALGLLGGKEVPGRFMYSPIIGAHILSGILVNATGRPVIDFAAEHLFSPLGISIPHNVVLPSEEEHLAYYTKDKHKVSWTVDPQGIHTASWGLALTAADMAKIGQLYLNNGNWLGKQIVSAKWIKESTRRHSSFNNLSYGYLWWIIDEKEQSYAALGDGGNVIYVNTGKQLVVSITSLLRPDTQDRIEFIIDRVEPLIEEEHPPLVSSNL